MKQLALPLIVLALSPCATAQPAFGDPVAIRGGDGFEECREEYVTTEPLTGYDVPNQNGSPIRTVLTGRRIEANDRSEAWTVVVRPGRLRAIRPVVLTAQRYGPIRQFDWRVEAEGEASLRLDRGDEIEHLMAVGEGYTLFRLGGDVYLGDGIAVGGDGYEGDFSEVATTDLQLWLHLVPRDGKPAAWVNVTGRTRVLGCAGW